MTSFLSYDSLRELLDAATPGQWSVSPFYAGIISDRFGKDGDFLPIALMLWPTDERTEAETYANAALVVETRAALPDLLTRIADLEGELKRREANEAQNCINWGPCSRNDGRMTEPAAALRALSGTDTGEKVG